MSPRSEADGVARAARAGGRVALGALHALFGATFLFGWIRIAAEHRIGRTDFISLTVAARLSAHAPRFLYEPTLQYAVQLLADPATGPARPFTNPPYVATYARALLALGPTAGYLVLGLVNLALLAVIGRLILQILAGQPRQRRAQVLLGSFAMFSVGNALAEGTVSVAVALGVCLVLDGDRRHHETMMAAGLALTCWKPHLAVIVWAAMAITGRWRVVGRAAAMSALLAAPSLLTPGPRAWLAYPGALADAGEAGAAAVRHSDHWWNLAAIGYRTLPASLVGPLCLAAFVVGLLGLAVAHRRRPARVPLTVVLLGGVLLAPHANPHDYIWLAVGFALLRGEACWAQRPRWARGALSTIAGAGPLLSALTAAFANQGGSVVAVGALGTFAALCVAGAPVQADATVVALPAPRSHRPAA